MATNLLSPLRSVPVFVMNPKQINIIPPKYFGYHKNLKIVETLRKLEIGESVKFSIDAWGTLHSCAKSAGIRIVTRSLGSNKEVTIWRIQ